MYVVIAGDSLSSLDDSEIYGGFTHKTRLDFIPVV